MHDTQTRRRRALAGLVTTGALLAAMLVAGTAPAVATPGAAPASTSGTPCSAPWAPGAVYTGGALVSYEGKNYRAKWWTQDNAPGTEQYGPWEDLGPCGDDDPTGADPTGTDPTGEDPTGTDPTGTDPTGTDPTGTDATGGDPTGTDPTGTDPTGTDPTGGDPTGDPTGGETPEPPSGHEACRPDGLYKTPGVDVPYCDVYDTDGREKLPNDLDRRVIGYFTSWRTGANDQPRYLASDIPWDKLSHINYAFAHVGPDNKVSVNAHAPGNSATDMTWPGVPGAEMDPSLDYTGHFNLLAKYKKENPGVKVLPAVGGWAETGGYFDADGNRVASGGFYTMTESQAKIDVFADSVVEFVREYGFDGIDIDYEYPTSNNQAGNPDDFAFSDARRGQLWEGYENLMRTLRHKLDEAAAEDGTYYMLTTASPSSGWLLRGMEVHQVVQYLDYVNLMTYDLHGAWNEYVGGNSPLFDDGKDPELTAAGVYSAYQGMGYLNGDWAAHYFRGAVQAGRINLGVGFYTRGFQNVQGGTHGMGGRAPAPAGFPCPPGTSNKCGYGAEGIDNLWYDSDPMGNAIPAGVNPIWHALNLQQGVVGDYVSSYGVTPNLTGTYTHHFDPVSKNEWWWNDQNKVFLSGDTAQAIGEKADYVADTGLGGLMIWELAGDYGYNDAKGQYEMGQTMVDLMHDTFTSAGAYGATKANADRPMPSQAIDLSIEYTEFALGDNNYPISPKVVFTNNSSTDIPEGATISFQYATTDLGEMSDWSGFGTTTTSLGHTGPNVGGLQGDFHTAQFTVPMGGIPAGEAIVNQLKWTLPIAQFSNVIVTIGGESYATTYDHPRGVTVVEPVGGTGNGNGNGDGNGDGGTGGCTAPAWSAGAIYTGGDLVTHGGREWRASYWTNGDTPGAGQWGPWALVRVC